MKNNILLRLIVRVVRSIMLRTSKLLKPILRECAELCDIRLNHPWARQGAHSIEFSDDMAQVKNNIPKSVYFNTASGTIRIGRNAVFGEDVLLLTGMHYDKYTAEHLGVPHHAVPESGRDIEIGEGCYIGSGAIVIGPCTVGAFSVIGAGAIVVKNVPPNSIVVGTPAQRMMPLKHAPQL